MLITINFLFLIILISTNKWSAAVSTTPSPAPQQPPFHEFPTMSTRCETQVHLDRKLPQSLRLLPGCASPLWSGLIQYNPFRITAGRPSSLASRQGVDVTGGNIPSHWWNVEGSRIASCYTAIGFMTHNGKWWTNQEWIFHEFASIRVWNTPLPWEKLHKTTFALK